MKSRYRRLEGGAQFWRSHKALDRTSQIPGDERKTFNIDIITGAGDNVINHQPALTCIICKPQFERNAPGLFARRNDFRSQMDR